MALLPVGVSVSPEKSGTFAGDTSTDTACIPDTNEECVDTSGITDTRANIIRKAADSGMSRKDIALLIGGNYNKAYQQVKLVLDA